MPDLGIVKKIPPEFLFNYFPIKRPQVLSLRGGTSFWVTAGTAGVRSSILTVPVTFPSEAVENGELLSGLPLPDIRGTIGTFYYFATDLSRYEEGNTEMGGILKRLVFDGDVARTELVGPPNPVVKAQQRADPGEGPEARRRPTRPTLADLATREDVRIPITVRWNRQQRRATIEIRRREHRARRGPVEQVDDPRVPRQPLVRLHGMAQIFLIKADKELQLYISPVNFRPDKPPVPISAPASFSENLYERLGFFRTLGWAEATWPLNEDRIDEKAFMDDLYRAFDDRAQVILQPPRRRPMGSAGRRHRVDRPRAAHDVAVPATRSTRCTTRRGAAKYGDSIERVYRRADQFVAEVRERVGPDVPIMVVSDHGFHSFRTGRQPQHVARAGGVPRRQGRTHRHQKTLDNLFLGTGEFWENVDWSKTKAYAHGPRPGLHQRQGPRGPGHRQSRARNTGRSWTIWRRD